MKFSFIKKKNYKNLANLIMPNVYALEQHTKIKSRDAYHFFEQLHLFEDDVIVKSRAVVEKDNFIDETNLIEINKLDLETEMLHNEHEQPKYEWLHFGLLQDEPKNEQDGEEETLPKSTLLFDNFVKADEPDVFEDDEIALKQNLFYNWVCFFDFFFKTKSIILKNFILFNNIKTKESKRAKKDKHLHKIILNATSRNFYITLLTPERTKQKNFKQKKENQQLKKALALKYKINIIDDKKKIKKKPFLARRTLRIKKRIILVAFSLGLTGFKSKKAKNQPFVLKLLILHLKNYLTIYSQRYFLKKKTEPIFSIILKTSLSNPRIKLVFVELLNFIENDTNSPFKN